jgi:hypothetical protein
MNCDLGILARIMYSYDSNMIASMLNAGMNYVWIRVSEVRFSIDWKERGRNGKQKDGTRRYESWSELPFVQKV